LPKFEIRLLVALQMDHIEAMQDAAEKSARTPDEPPSLAELSLAGGPVIRFRHVCPEDESLITEAIRTASRQTLLHRFFSPIRSVSPDQLRRMLAIDRANEVCIVGVITEHNVTRIICGGRYVRLSKPAAAEIAITVHDEFQYRGLGTFLLRLLARLAVTDGIRTFEADVMSSNRKMSNLFRKLAPNLTAARRMGDVIHFVFNVSEVTTGTGEQTAS
jgi:RimJ/RimL family protein N-acetyltransferase